MRIVPLLLAVAFLARAAAPTTPVPVDERTELLYLFDSLGELGRDSAHVGRHGDVLGDAMPATGRFGGGLDTRRGNLRIPHCSSMDLTTGLTLDAWICTEGRSEEIQRIAFRSSIYGLYLDKAGMNLTFYVNVDGGWTGLNAPVPGGEWVHLAGTYDGETLRVLVNGNVEAEKHMPGTIVSSTVPMEIGGEGDVRRFLNGTIDDVRLSSAARADFARVLTFEPTVVPRTVALPDGEIPVMVPEAVAGFASKPPRIDGVLDDVVWQKALRLRLDDTPPNRRITQRTTAFLAYDASNLYVGGRCRDVNVANIRRDVSKHDGPVWNDDCVEVFLQPPESGTYYHIAANATGTVYDGDSVPPSDCTWESGAKAVAGIGEGEWTIEMAIPLASLGGGPISGQEWRLNICRERVEGPELSSWSPVAGRFHSPGKFGRVQFRDTPAQPAESATALEGVVVDTDGERLGGVPVMCGVRTARTDARGRFEMSGLPRGTTTLAIVSPRYEPLAVEVDLSRELERTVLPPARRVDPNALRAGAGTLPEGIVLIPFSPLDDVDTGVPLPSPALP